MEHTQFLWAACAKVSPPSQYTESNLNLPFFSLRPLSHIFSLWKVPLQHFCRPPLCTFRCYEMSPEPHLLQPEQSQLSHPVFVGEELQPPEHFHGLLWACFNRSTSSSCQGPQGWVQNSRWGHTVAVTAQPIPYPPPVIQPPNLCIQFRGEDVVWTMSNILHTSRQVMQFLFPYSPTPKWTPSNRQGIVINALIYAWIVFPAF